MPENSQAEAQLIEPKIVKSPYKRLDGSLLAVGDKITHERQGTGKVVGLADYETIGVCACILFDSGTEGIISIESVKKC